MEFRQLLEIASRVECKKTNHKEGLGTDSTLQTEGQADRYDLHVRLFFSFVQMAHHVHVKGYTIIHVDVIQKVGNNMPTKQ